jgi:hypothetical protein
MVMTSARWRLYVGRSNISHRKQCRMYWAATAECSHALYHRSRRHFQRNLECFHSTARCKCFSAAE